MCHHPRPGRGCRMIDHLKDFLIRMAQMIVLFLGVALIVEDEFGTLAKIVGFALGLAAIWWIEDRARREP